MIRFLFWLSLMAPSLVAAEAPVPAGEFFIRLAVHQTPSMFGHLFSHYGIRADKLPQLKAVEEASQRFAKNQNELVVFRDGSDPIFQLRKGEPVRMAVTSLDEDGPVYLNRQLTANLNYPDILKLWFHEMGHKIKEKFPKLTQQEIDDDAQTFAKTYGSVMKTWSLAEGSVLVSVNPVADDHDVLDRRSFAFVELKNGMVTDRSAELHTALDAALPSYAKYTEINRRALDIYLTAEGRLGIWIRSGHFLKPDLKEYSENDFGGGHFSRAILDRSSLKVESYGEELRQPDVVDDGLIRIQENSLQTSAKAISGIFDFEMYTERYFHAPTYPWDAAEVVAMVDGVPRRLPIRLRYWMEGDIGRMPNEAYKKLSQYSAYFSIEATGLLGHKVVIQSLVSQVFVLGGYQPVRNNMRQIRLNTPFEVTWNPAGCDEALTGRDYVDIEAIIASGN